MARRKRRKTDQQCIYDISVDDWSVCVRFNDYAYINVFDREEFEEHICMILEGCITSTTSKKLKKILASRVILHPGDFWYEKEKLRDDLHIIGNAAIMKANTFDDKEDTLYFWVNVPTKTYENIKDYLIYKGKAKICLVGTELFRRKGEIRYLGFEKWPS
ncbi:MAG: hypothetical protein V3U54_10600 [Thermodesulfobacteriota bacterium]